MELRSGSRVNRERSLSFSHIPKMESASNLDNNLESILNNILKPLEVNIKKMSETLVNLRSLFENRINILQTRINILESRCAINENMLHLHDRKIDDNEQYSRKINLKLVGIKTEKKENPYKLMAKIKKSIYNTYIDIDEYDFDRCHRIGRPYEWEGKKVQDVLLRFTSWDARNTIYQNRKDLPFIVRADLTNRRADLLEYARDVVKNDPNVENVVEFAYTDENCKMKLFTKSKKHLAFNSKEEFLSIASRLDLESKTSQVILIDDNDRTDLETHE